MSFSFGAEGTREECIKSLNSSSHHELTADGQIARGLVLAFLADAPASASTLEPIRYDISAHGHRDPHRGHAPSLSVHLEAIQPDSSAADTEAAAASMLKPLVGVPGR
jgi:hypothetical protein